METRITPKIHDVQWVSISTHGKPGKEYQIYFLPGALVVRDLTLGDDTTHSNV